MAKEYIEREAALKFLENSLTFSETELDMGEYRKGCIAAIQDDIGNIKNMPAADVVPKSEVEHILSDLKKEIHDKAVFPNNGAVSPYINLKVLDAVIQKHIDKIKGDI